MCRNVDLAGLTALYYYCTNHSARHKEPNRFVKLIMSDCNIDYFKTVYWNYFISVCTRKVTRDFSMFEVFDVSINTVYSEHFVKICVNSNIGILNTHARAHTMS